MYDVHLLENIETYKGCRAAALATACKVEVKLGAGYSEVRNNDVLGMSSASVV